MSRRIGIIIAATLLSGAMFGSASAMPALPMQPALQGGALAQQVRLVCNESRCIDPETGAYTKSNCNRNGCYPSSGVIGYTTPPRGGGYYRPRPRYEEAERYYGRRYNRDGRWRQDEWEY